MISHVRSTQNQLRAPLAQTEGLIRDFDRPLYTSTWWLTCLLLVFKTNKQIRSHNLVECLELTQVFVLSRWHTSNSTTFLWFGHPIHLKFPKKWYEESVNIHDPKRWIPEFQWSQHNLVWFPLWNPKLQFEHVQLVFFYQHDFHGMIFDDFLFTPTHIKNKGFL